MDFRAIDTPIGPLLCVKEGCALYALGDYLQGGRARLADHEGARALTEDERRICHRRIDFALWLRPAKLPDQSFEAMNRLACRERR